MWEGDDGGRLGPKEEEEEGGRLGPKEADGGRLGPISLRSGLLLRRRLFEVLSSPARAGPISLFIIPRPGWRFEG